MATHTVGGSPKLKDPPTLATDGAGLILFGSINTVQADAFASNV
jgi:hypothetical protein